MHCKIGGTQGPLGYVNALGATRLVHWLILVAPSCLRSHNARYIMLKSLIKSCCRSDPMHIPSTHLQPHKKSFGKLAKCSRTSPLHWEWDSRLVGGLPSPVQMMTNPVQRLKVHRMSRVILLPGNFTQDHIYLSDLFYHIILLHKGSIKRSIIQFMMKWIWPHYNILSGLSWCSWRMVPIVSRHNDTCITY